MKRRFHLIPSVAVLYLIALLVAPWPVAAQAAKPSPVREQDRAAYDARYHAQLVDVRRTPTGNDDHALAQSMLAFAKDIPGDLGMRCLIYADSVTLAASASDLGLLREAYTLLNAAWPQQNMVLPQQLMQIASRAYRGVDRTERDTQGQHYIHLLLHVADHDDLKNDPEQALSVCRLASTVARAIDSPKADSISQRIQHLNDILDTNRKIRNLKTTLSKKPDSSTAAKRLVHLLMTRHHAPADALAYVALTQDEELIDRVKHAAAGLEHATPATAMRVADWYFILANDQPETHALTMLGQARRWYARFADQYQREDALAKRVAQMDQNAQAKIKAILSNRPDLNTQQGWVSLITPSYNPNKYTNKRKEIKPNKDGTFTLKRRRIHIPVDLFQAYEVKVVFTITEDAEKDSRVLAVGLPYQNCDLVTDINLTHDKYVDIQAVRNENRHFASDPSQVGEKNELHFQTVIKDGQVKLAMLYNNKLALQWEGPADQLYTLNREAFYERNPDSKYSILIFGNEVVVHSMMYRPRPQ